jgi:hypothetical protein
MPLGNVFGNSFYLLVAHIRRGDHDLEGGDRRWQPETVLVITLLDRGSQNALDPNPIAPHDGSNLFAIAVENASAHGFRILVAQLENVSDLDRGVDA